MTNEPYTLIVDDELRLSRNLVCYLKRHGFDTAAVGSVSEANEKIIKRRPDLVLLDLKLPDYNGIVLARMLRDKYSRVPVVVISASISEEDKSRLIRSGVRHFLTKPFSMEKLRSVLASIIDQDNAVGLSKPQNVVRYREKKISRAPLDRRPRIALYSHDTMGLGHMRRNILIARTLAKSRLNASVLLVTGARQVGRFELPDGIDCLVLPSYSKSVSGNYESRHLDIRTRELVRLRSQSVSASIAAFNPELMVVDNVPRGAQNELDGMLSGVKARGYTKMVLGLRDVLDEPGVTRGEWGKRNNLDVIDWYYDQVWVYGAPDVYNFCDNYRFGERFDSKVMYTGYLDARKRAAPKVAGNQYPAPVSLETGKSAYNLCMVGGGQDGFVLAEAFALASHPADRMGIIITGPFMDSDKIRRLQDIVQQKPNLHLFGFVSEPTRFLQEADRVVAMGGYNTTIEVLAFNKPTLIVPRVRPRLEQLIRAERLSELGYIDLLHPEKLTPLEITRWLSKAESDLPGTSSQFDLQGLDRLTGFVEKIIQSRGVELEAV